MSLRSPRHPRGQRPRTLRTVTLLGTVVAVQLAAATPASAEALVVAQPASLDQVITNLRNFLIGLLVGLATLFLTIGGVRYLAADGDPGEVERAKKSLRNALIGYGLAMLAPLLVTILQGLVG
ncbi:pilin [Saccharomonospora piscinae]|uniref:pilin n=1 Tax=Saccharomonospora piscinae TaxID=687388 RepID=UPI00046687BF|nr:pilin [Saccharomonospora piscinae]